MITAMDKVNIARHKKRPTTLDYIHKIFDEFIEFHGDRLFRDDPSIVGGIASLDGQAITVIGHQKGRNTKENIFRNFGMPSPEGYRKALRLMKQAEKFNRPVLTFIDTPGAYCGIGAEERGQGEAIASCLIEMAGLRVPTLSIVIGEGGSGGALALGITDKIWMLENSIYSVLSPEGFASILWKDPSRSKEAAEMMKLTAKDLKEFMIIDHIVPEPPKGAHEDVDKVAVDIKEKLSMELIKIKGLDTEDILERRGQKFRNLGKFSV